jgi:hypothetical protein
MQPIQLRDGFRERVTRPSSPPHPFQQSRLIEIRAVDRETARKNMTAGLVAGGFAAGVFALCFIAAFLYIAQS